MHFSELWLRTLVTRDKNDLSLSVMLRRSASSSLSRLAADLSVAPASCSAAMKGQEDGTSLELSRGQSVGARANLLNVSMLKSLLPDQTEETHYQLTTSSYSGSCDLPRICRPLTASPGLEGYQACPLRPSQGHRKLQKLVCWATRVTG